jgi:hypothetical protein
LVQRDDGVGPRIGFIVANVDHRPELQVSGAAERFLRRWQATGDLAATVQRGPLPWERGILAEELRQFVKALIIEELTVHNDGLAYRLTGTDPGHLEPPSSLVGRFLHVTDVCRSADIALTERRTWLDPIGSPEVGSPAVGSQPPVPSIFNASTTSAPSRTKHLTVRPASGRWAIEPSGSLVERCEDLV